MQELRGRGGGGGGGGGGGSAGGAGGASAGPNHNGGGWPLGLQPLHLHIQMTNVMSRAVRSREPPFFSTAHHHHRPLRFLQPGDVSPFFLSTYTPSISSLSSSDLDTESTGSFFPERSTTLGTLIGIHSRSQRNQPTAMDNVTTQLLQSKHMSKTQRLHACWCALTLIMKCACSNSNVNPSQESSFSPSLAHLLELERKAAHTQPQEGASLQCESLEDNNEFEDSNEESPPHLPQDIPLFDGVGECSQPHSRPNTLFNDDGILPPHSSGAPLKVALRQLVATSPTTSTYLSTDWNAGVPIVRQRKHYHSSHGRFHTSLCPSFWKPN